MNDEQDEDKIREFPLRLAANLDRIVGELKQATAALIDSGGIYDLMCGESDQQRQLTGCCFISEHQADGFICQPQRTHVHDS